MAWTGIHEGYFGARCRLVDADSPGEWCCLSADHDGRWHESPSGHQWRGEARHRPVVVVHLPGDG